MFHCYYHYQLSSAFMFEGHQQGEISETVCLLFFPKWKDIHVLLGFCLFVFLCFLIYCVV